MEKQKTHTLLKYLMSSCVVDSLIMQKTQKQTTRKISLNGSTLVKSPEYDDISLEMFLELVVIHLAIRLVVHISLYFRICIGNFSISFATV